MSDGTDEIRARLQEAQELPSGSAAKVALLEDAVRMADVLGDIDLAFAAREELVSAACWAGEPTKMLVAFSYCLGQVDKYPDRFPLRVVLWYYKWVAAEAPCFPEISRAQIEAMISDMTERFRRIGSSLRPVHAIRSGAAIRLGDVEAAHEAHRAFQDTPRDHMSNCAACETDEEVYFFVWAEQYERALAVAAPLLAGRQSCMEVPQRTYARVLLPLLHLGRLDEAAEHHRRGLRALGKLAKKLVEHVAEHVVFLALTGNLTRALNLLEKHCAAALSHTSAVSRFQFNLAWSLTLNQVRAAGRTTVKMKLPAVFSGPKGPEHDVAALLAIVLGEARAIAARFDARNGNTYVSGLIDRSAELSALAIKYPLRRGSGI